MLITKPDTGLLTALFLLLALFAGQSAAANPRQLQHAVYEGDYNGMTIRLDKELLDLGEGVFELRAKADNFLGSINEHERFRWNPDGSITPLSYHYKQRVFGVSKKRSINFDWEKKTAAARDHKKAEQIIPLAPGMLGPMSYQLQLQLDLVRQKNTLLKKTKAKDGQTQFSSTEQIRNRVFEYTFIYRNKVRTYGFAIDSVQTLQQKSVHIRNALLLNRTTNDEQKSTQIWFDIDDNFVLASLQQNDDDASHQLFIKKNAYFPPFNDTPFSLLCPPADPGN